MMMLLTNDENLIWTKGVGNVYSKDGSHQVNSAGFREAVGAVRVLNSEVQITTGNPIQIISEFINTGEDVPVRAMTLVETYRRLKTA